MTSREIFKRIMNYQPVSRIPLMVIDPFESLTVDKWRNQGLPTGVAPCDYLNMDIPPDFWVNLGPIPAFETTRISENATEYVELDGMGCTVKRLQEAPDMYYGIIDHPVKSADDWEKYKKRLDAATPGRHYPDMEKMVEVVNKSEVPVGLSLYPWFFRFSFYLMGMERFLTAFYDMPELIHNIFSYYADFTLEIIRPILNRVKFDFACYSEDLAYRTAPHISPDIYKKFWLPYQDPITAEMKRAGIEIISMYTSGNCEAILPLLMEHGINCTWPCERNANMDPIKLRAKYGKELRLVGGVGHTSLSKGPAAIDEEIDRLIPLIREGGFIPLIDDMVPPEVSFENYKYAIEKMRAIQM